MRIAVLLAQVFAAVRLLPPTHPYLYPGNAGRFGIRHVIAEAAGRLEFTRNKADQVLVFATLVCGLVILCIQVALLFAVLITQPVFAQTFSDVFLNPSPSFGSMGPHQDVALGILDRVFGVRGIFGSCISEPGVACTDIHGNPTFTPSQYPYPIHVALHQMLGFYSLGIGLVGLVVILYQVITVVGETAVSGTPFGRRYNRTWAPVRMIMFFALLAPLNVGSEGNNAWLNGAQLIALWTAKHGSNVATNGWARYNQRLLVSFLGTPQELIARPKTPSFGYVLQFYTAVHACKIAYERKRGAEIKSYLVKTGGAIEAAGASFQQALEFANNGNIAFRFGVLDPDTNRAHMGSIRPLCGQISLPVGDITQPGARAVTEHYFNMLKDFYNTDAGGGYMTHIFANCIADKTLVPNSNTCQVASDGDMRWLVSNISDYFNTVNRETLDRSVERQVNEGDFTMPPGLMAKGWGGAAVWYNTLAEMNGAVTGAAMAVPSIEKYPEIMQKIEDENRSHAQNVVVGDRFNPGVIGTDPARMENPDEYQMAMTMYKAHKIFEDYNPDETPQTKRTGNIGIDTINALLGTSGLFSMRENKDIHPLAQLSVLGKGMVEHAIRNFGAAIGLSVGGGVMRILADLDLKTGSIENFLRIFAQVGFLIGFILFYVLPFMPFIYFFFALGGWIKSIFEAVVAMPLWALAHLTIDGQGLPGRAASNGYFLLFEIFARPIMTLVGLIGSLTIFASLVYVLNDVYDLVVVNVAGQEAATDAATADPTEIAYYRSSVDEFFFTLIYTVIVYMIGLSCFKLIDQVPDKTLRWMGSGTPTFTESDKNAAEEALQKIYQSTQINLGQLQGGQIAALIR